MDGLQAAGQSHQQKLSVRVRSNFQGTHSSHSCRAYSLGAVFQKEVCSAAHWWFSQTSKWFCTGLHIHVCSLGYTYIEDSCWQISQFNLSWLAQVGTDASSGEVENLMILIDNVHTNLSKDQFFINVIRRPTSSEVALDNQGWNKSDQGGILCSIRVDGF